MNRVDREEVFHKGSLTDGNMWINLSRMCTSNWAGTGVLEKTTPLGYNCRYAKTNSPTT